jgi:hypothetical protein
MEDFSEDFQWTDVFPGCFQSYSLEIAQNLHDWSLPSCTED